MNGKMIMAVSATIAVMAPAMNVSAEEKTYVDFNFGSQSSDAVIKEKDLWLTDSSIWGGVAAGDPTKDYRVTLYNKIENVETRYYKSSECGVFTGRSITFGNIAANKAGGLSSRMSGGYLEFSNEGAYLENGKFQQISSGNQGYIKGILTVVSPIGSEYQIRSSHVNSSLRASSWLIAADVVCPEENGLLLSYSPNNDDAKRAAAAGGYWPVSFTGDLSQFYGLLTVQNNVLFAADSMTFPGTVKLEKNALIGAYSATDTLKIHSLRFAGSNRLLVPQNANGGSSACVEVTDSLDFPDTAKPIKVQMTGSAAFASDSTDCVIFKVAKDAFARDLTESDFDLDLSKAKDLACAVKLEVGKDADGNQIVTLKAARSLVKQVLSDAVTLDKVGDTQSGYTNKTSWSDGEAPHSEAAYYVVGQNAALRTPYAPNGTSEFAGDAIILDNTTKIHLRTPDNTIAELYVDNYAYIYNYYEFNSILRGEITICGNLSIYSYGAVPDSRSCYRGIKIYSNIKGSGVLRASINNGSSNVPGETFLGGDNSEFTGQLRVTVDTQPNKGYPNYEKGYAVCSFEDAAKLGGALSAFTADSILVNQKCVLRPLCSTTHSEMTRGITFCDGRVNTAEADTVFTVKPPVRFQYLMRKEGLGTMVLESAGTCSFTGCVEVLGGSLQARNKDAFAGAPMTFAEGTGLRYDIRPTDSGMATYGVYATAANAITASGAALKVSFVDDDIDAALASPREVALMTVASDEAAALKAKIEGGIEKPFASLDVKIDTKTIDANTTTIYATLTKLGMRVIVR